MDNATNISIIVSACAAVVALIITVAIHLHSLKREIKFETIKVFSVFREKFFDIDKNSDESYKLKYVTELEFFAVGVNQKIYDIKIVAKMSGNKLLSQYRIWMEDFIEKRRGAKQSSAYKDIDYMMDLLRAFTN